MKKNILIICLLVIAVIVSILNGCKQDNISLPLEPISLVQPDSSIVQHFAGDSVPLQLQFTTDRPIDWVLVTYAIDTSGLANNLPSIFDTLFLKVWNTDSARTNSYPYKGVYYIPDSLKAYSIVYFDASFQAGSTSFVVGQNYPAGVVNSSKQFKVEIR